MSGAEPLQFVRPLLRARDWQNRAQFDELCAWWRDGGFGVCALIGIGGAGKTAIVERFLQVLPGGYRGHPRVPKDATLPPPDRLFVFSFYEAPNPDVFFREILTWLTGQEPQVVPSYAKMIELLEKAGRCLLVLDGLEKVQEDGTRGSSFGQISDGRLRNLVVQVSDGWLPNVSLMITSRFYLFDPLADRTFYYRQIGVERLEPATAVQLLRDRGVRGTDDELERVAEELGFHALSVDLAGGYIAKYLRGRASRWDSFAETDADARLDPNAAYVQQQERRFARLAERYRESLAASDPAALALLQRVCLFRRGATAEMLETIFLGKDKTGISGKALASLSPKKLTRTLTLLSEMRLMEAAPTTPPMYTVHPAVRDGFLRGLDAEMMRSGHEAARHALEASLGGRPGRNPADAALLDAIEEIVHHAFAAGHADEAASIYRFWLGAYGNLGHRLGAFDRGDRICRSLIGSLRSGDAASSTHFSLQNQGFLANDWALYLDNLGRLEEAAFWFEWASAVEQQYSVVYQNLAGTRAAAGRLQLALQAVAESVRVAEAEDAASEVNALAYRGYIRTLRGDLQDAVADFERSVTLYRLRTKRGYNALRATFRAELFVYIGRIHEALDAARINDEVSRELYGNEHLWTGQSHLVMADALRLAGDTAGARPHLQRARDWALQREAKHPLSGAARVAAAIELDSFAQSAAPAALDAASAAVEDGLRIARECGYGILHIDLLLLRAQLALHEGRAEDAIRDINVAISEGVHPAADSGYPELLAATDPECGYAWGIAEGHQLLAEALLLQAARNSADAESLKAQARQELDAALESWRALRDPGGAAEMHPRAERTVRVRERLEQGVLTSYPIATSTVPAAQPAPQAARRSRSVFISYAHADEASSHRWLTRLLEHLRPLVRQQDLVVWSDRQLMTGDRWHEEIQRQLEEAAVAVLLISRAFLASEYVANSELPLMLRRAHEGGLKILPVLVSPSMVHRTRFGPEQFTLVQLQAAGTPSQTLSDMSEAEQERTLVALADRILELVDYTSPQ